jgi:tetratricopeptide (TPR) repeat protein
VIPLAHHSDDRVDNTVSGGIFFSAVIQGRDISVVLPPQITPAMAGLPAASAAFTGRAPDLDTLLQVLVPRRAKEAPGGDDVHSGTARAEAVLVTAVGGMGGIGKTELALQAAHAALGRGWFPGGVLFVDMFGYDPGRRLTADHAAAGFVRALGIPGEHIPADAQELERLLRSVLDAYATQGRPVLLVIDNVSDQAQAAPLLPAHPACRAIVTSRHTLGLLGGRLIDLDTLDTDQAVELLRRAVEVARPGDQRVVGHPSDARQVTEACAGLPLALRIVAALLADNPGRPLAAMASDLHDQASRLAELTYGNDALTAVFDLSYQHLPADQARLFRLLSVNPGSDIATTAAAALTGLPKAAARRGLEALARAHLIEPGSAYGRWRMHDLIRLHSAHHAHAHADADQRPEAITRLLEHYLATTRAACAHLDPIVADPSSLGFPSREQALAWLDAEYPNLTAATYAAAGSGHLTIARDLPAAMQDFLLRRRHFSDWITLSQTALTAAQALQDRRGQGAALNSLGIALRLVRRFDEATAAHQQDLQICRDTGDRHGEGKALGNLAIALAQAGRFDEAITAHQDAVQICRDTGDRHGEGTALNNLGGTLAEVGRFDEAITALQQNLQICRDTGDRHGEGMALGNLGIALDEVGRFDEAITAHQDAAQICRDTGDRHSEGMAVDNLGVTLARAGRFDEAITVHQQNLQICRDTGDRHGEGKALGNLGITLARAGRFDEAITADQDAAQIFRDTGDRHGEEIALNNLQEARQAQDGEPGTSEPDSGSTEYAR